MSRRPDGDEARTVVLHFRVAPCELADIDGARAGESRSAYLRRLIEAANEREERDDDNQ
jgi:hypothetical protein